MELKKLSIHNIASIADAEIDFKGESLSGASIFLICGETGAGKSTILDAICLALFEKTPRMSSVSREEIASYDENENKWQYYNKKKFSKRYVLIFNSDEKKSIDL